MSAICSKIFFYSTFVYTGSRSTTLSGKTCLHWSTVFNSTGSANFCLNQTSIEGDRWHFVFPGKCIHYLGYGVEENYCRNFDQDPAGPWCYVSLEETESCFYGCPEDFETPSLPQDASPFWFPCECFPNESHCVKPLLTTFAKSTKKTIRSKTTVTTKKIKPAKSSAAPSAWNEFKKGPFFFIMIYGLFLVGFAIVTGFAYLCLLCFEQE